jgi:hypothetical protein
MKMTDEVMKHIQAAVEYLTSGNSAQRVDTILGTKVYYVGGAIRIDIPSEAVTMLIDNNSLEPR